MATKRDAHSDGVNVAIDENVIITLMGKFSFIIGTHRAEAEILRSKKGFSLLAYLIAHNEGVSPLKTLYGIMWADDESGNPENALKTLISRMRTTLNHLSPGSGDCIINNRGGYSWKCREGMTIDLYEIRRLLEVILNTNDDDERVKALRPLIELYKGDLLSGYDCEWARDESRRLREEYVMALCSVIEIYKKRGEYDEVVKICRSGLYIDAFNETFHVELMNSLSESDRTAEALAQYKHAADLHCRYRQQQPPSSLQSSYRRLTRSGGTLDAALMKVMRELREHSASSGAFLCEYSVLREVYGLQMRNLERIGQKIFLSVIMISDEDGQPMEPLLQSEVMRGAISILRHNLRRGDTITQASPTILAMLLPSVDYSTGNSVLERIRSAFFLRYPNSGIVFSFRLSPLDERDADE